MKKTPEQEARYALDFGVSRSDLGLGAQVEYDRLVAEGYGTPRQERPQTREERKLAVQARREESARKRQEAEELAAATAWFPALGVAVRDGGVYRGPTSDLFSVGKRRVVAGMELLGPLAGARAEVGGGKGGKARRTGGARASDALTAFQVLGPVGLLAGMSQKGFEGYAVVALANGIIRERRFERMPSASFLIDAQAEAARFNALAAAESRQAADGAVPDSAGVAAELERLAALRSSGMLDAEEFRAAKARIIGS